MHFTDADLVYLSELEHMLRQRVGLSSVLLCSVELKLFRQRSVESVFQRLFDLLDLLFVVILETVATRLDQCTTGK